MHSEIPARISQGVHARVAATVEEPGSYILNAQDFYQYIRVIPENEIELIVNIIKVLGRSDLGITRATLD